MIKRLKWSITPTKDSIYWYTDIVHFLTFSLSSFILVSNFKFNTQKILTLWVHAGLFWCFHYPPHLDMDYRIFNVRMWSFCMHMCTHCHWGPRFLVSFNDSHSFCTVCTEFESQEISGWAQSPGHNFGFQKQVFLLCSTDYPVGGSSNWCTVWSSFSLFMLVATL